MVCVGSRCSYPGGVWLHCRCSCDKLERQCRLDRGKDRSPCLFFVSGRGVVEAGVVRFGGEIGEEDADVVVEPVVLRLIVLVCTVMVDVVKRVLGEIGIARNKFEKGDR
ncbi:hypothetical protein ACLB2K_033181 [Fragaria x ananassa]